MSQTRNDWVRLARRIGVASLVAGCVAVAGCSSDDDDDDTSTPTDPTDPTTPGEPLATLGVPGEDVTGFTEGVVTAAHPLAAEAGREILEQGGNAIDAAIAVQFVLNVVEPTSSGIGGGGFMGVHLADTDRTFFIDSREKAPAAATPTMFLACDPNCDGTNNDTIGSFTERATSGIAVGVPGTLLALEHAHSEYGSGALTFADLIAPAIPLAREGFEINERLATLTASDRTAFWPETAAKFRDENGDPLQPGFLLVQPDLADTLQTIADDGVEAFYTGDMAAAIVEAQSRAREEVGDAGLGRMVVQDLQDYLDSGIDERDPVMAMYRGYEIAGMPSPSSGGNTVGQILACLEQFELGDEEAGFGFGTTNTFHVMAESMRLAFSSRSIWMGDADAVDLPDAGLLNADYLAPRCAQIMVDSRIADEEVLPGDPRPFDPAFADTEATSVGTATGEPEGVDTTHFTVIDGMGNVVSYTSTIEGTWGSGITVPGFGFLLNNELTDFNSVPQADDSVEEFKPGANDVAAGKSPRSSMSPSMVFSDDRLVAAYGSPGGSTIINSVVNMTLNLIDHGMTVQEAIDAPRMHTSGGSVSIEAARGDGIAQEVLDGLTDLGHTVNTAGFGGDDEPYVQGSIQAIVVDNNTGTQYGGADDRRAGTVEGLPVAAPAE